VSAASGPSAAAGRTAADRRKARGRPEGSAATRAARRCRCLPGRPAPPAPHTRGARRCPWARAGRRPGRQRPARRRRCAGRCTAGTAPAPGRAACRWRSPAGPRRPGSRPGSGRGNSSRTDSSGDDWKRSADYSASGRRTGKSVTPETENPGRGRGLQILPAARLLGGGFGAVDQLDVRHRGVVAGAEAALQDAQVATRTVLVTRAELGEQVAHGFLVAQAGEGQAAVGDGVDLGQGDPRLGDAAQFLGLRQGGLDQLVLEQRGGHVLEHGFAVGAGAAELAAGFLVAHGVVPLSMNVGSVYFAVAIHWRWSMDCAGPTGLPGRIVAADLTGPSALLPPLPGAV